MGEGEAVDILLVEDDAEEAELAFDALRQGLAPARVALVQDGEAALRFVIDATESGAPPRAPRLILLDLKLPKVDGFGVLRRLKSDATAKIIPVVVLTSSKMDEDVLRSYQLGANGYIVKPIDFTEFSETMKRIGAYWLEINRGV